MSTPTAATSICGAWITARITTTWTATANTATAATATPAVEQRLDHLPQPTLGLSTSHGIEAAGEVPHTVGATPPPQARRRTLPAELLAPIVLPRLTHDALDHLAELPPSGEKACTDTVMTSSTDTLLWTVEGSVTQYAATAVPCVVPATTSLFTTTCCF